MRFHRTKFLPCRTNSEPKHLPLAGSRITQTVAQIAACGLVLSSAGFGAVYAWTCGAEHGPLLATLMVTMAVALELAKPLAIDSAFAAFRGWAVMRGLALAALALVALVFSLTAELQLVAASRGDLVAKREAVVEQRDDRREAIKSARAELATTAPARSVAEVQADIVQLLAGNPKAGDCTKLDGPVSRSVCPQVSVLRGEIERAERRGKLEAIIATNTGNQPAAGTIVKNGDPAGSALATYLATLGIAVPAGMLTDWLVLVPVFALELGAALSMLLVQSVSGPAVVSVQIGHQTAAGSEPVMDSAGKHTPARPQTASAAPVDTEKPAVRPDPVSKRRTPMRARKPRLGHASATSKAAAEQRILETLKDQGGKLEDASVRGVARLIGGKKSTVHNAVAALVAAGVVARIGSELVLQAA